MNTTVRTILVFLALVGAIVAASVMYRKVAAPAADSGRDSIIAAEESTLHPELQAGLEALREQRDDDALKHFGAVPKDSADYSVAVQRGAVILARRGDLIQAQAHVFGLTVMYPGDPQPHALLGWLFFMQEDYDRAELAALRALELNADLLDARYSLGLYRVAQGHTQRSVLSYLRAIHADPNGTEISIHRERLRRFHDEHAEAPGPHFVLAFLAGSMQDRRTEIEELEHYLELAPEGPEREAASLKLDEIREAVGAF